ncbi:hypothetical protein LG296_01745 [Ureibacillus chungkukjangi]|uniref:hypothetical protein n=1 Tax=Ureibacillus chungkukjangi TaxID=1202712 RepID=UPI00384A47AF
MIYIQYDSDGVVTTRHYKPFDKVYGLGQTKEELEQKGILVDNIPTPDTTDSTKDAVLKIALQDKTFYYEYIDRPLSIEEVVQQLKTENANLRLEMAQSNTELFEMMVAMNGGLG